MRPFVLALVAIVAACGSDPPAAAPSPPPPDASTPPPAATADAAAPVVVEAEAEEAEETEPERQGADHSGDATYYAATATGSCGIKTPADKLVGSVSRTRYATGTCGKCARVEGPKGSVVVKLIDKCGGCSGGDVDLATQAFVKIADKSAGRVKITWHLVACP